MDATDLFERERSRLFGIAYRMLGSIADADDAVQDAWLRWRAVDHDEVVNPAAFLTTVTSRLSLDRLKSAQVRREAYVGPWLPEPIATTTATDPESATVMEESIMLGFLTVLERLGPVERAVFVLREVFDMSYPEVARVVDRSEDNCRQIARRARNHVRAERPRIAPDPDRDRSLLDAFLAAILSGEVEQLEQLLHEDIVLVSDGGAQVRAARHPIVGIDRVVRFLIGVTKNRTNDPIDIKYVNANGQLSLYVQVEGTDATLLTFEADPTGTRVTRMFALRNPDKLHRFTS